MCCGYIPIKLNFKGQFFHQSQDHLYGARYSSWYSIHSWCDGSSDRYLMVDPLSYFSFQPVLHNWCNKGYGMCPPICRMVHIKEPLLLIRKSSSCSGSSRFPLLLSDSLLYVRCHITVNKNVLSMLLNKTYPSLQAICTSVKH